MVPVSGRLTMNGKPLTGVRLRFIPDSASKGLTAFADTDEDGRFRVTTQKPGDGIAPGEYKVDINMPSPIAPPDPGAKLGDLAAKAVKTSDVPAKYQDTKTSELSYTITGPQTLDIDLK